MGRLAVGEVSVSRTVSPEAPGGFVIPGGNSLPTGRARRAGFLTQGSEGRISWTGWHPVVCGPCGALRGRGGLARSEVGRPGEVPSSGLRDLERPQKDTEVLC